MTRDLTERASGALTLNGIDRELDHLRLELADFPTRPRRLAILSSIDRWLDCRLTLTEGGAPTSAAAEETR